MTGEPAESTPTLCRNPIRRLYDWALRLAQRRGSGWTLFFLALLESSFLPVPLSLLLTTLCLGAVRRSFRFALICSAGSICGGTLAYVLGYQAWDALQHFFIPYIFSQELFDAARQLYRDNAGVAILAAAVSPISYKTCALAAGVFKIDFSTFLLATAIGRPIRFFAVAALAYYFGERARKLIEAHFGWIAWGLLLVTLAVYILGRLLP